VETPRATQLVQVLKHGGLPHDARAVQCLADGLEQIAGTWPRWFVEQHRLADLEIAGALAKIIADANRLAAHFSADADPQYQLESILGAYCPGWPLDLGQLRAQLRHLALKAAFFAPFYSRGWIKQPTDADAHNWLFVGLHALAAQIGGMPPRHGARFYRFVKGCAELLAIDLRNIEEAALMKRLKRALRDERWRRAMEG
jgi:hypothetical protein